MSFPKAPIKRFNETSTCVPPPGSYDIKSSETSKGPVSFDKSQRFRKETDDVESLQNPSSMKLPPSPLTVRKQLTVSLKRGSSGKRAEKDLSGMKELRTRKEMEKEIRILITERGQQDKRLQALEEELAKSESKLCAAVREKTSLFANIASLEKQLLELNKTNELLKSKFSDDGTDKKMRSVWLELMKLRSLKVKMSLVKHEDMEAKLHTAQRNLKHSKEKIAQLEEQLPTESQEEEKCDSDNLLEYIAELGSNIAKQVDTYKQEMDRLEAMVEAKNKAIETLQCTLQTKEAMLSTKIKELHEKCKLLDQEKEQCKTVCEEKQQIAKAEIEQLKDKLSQEEKEHQKQEEAYKELSATMHKKLLEFQEEMHGEKELLERELKETMDELDKLYTKEEKVDKLLKQLEEENKSQAEKLMLLEAKLRRKNTELVTVTEAHSNITAKLQEEHSNTLGKLGETITEFETYKASMAEEITGLQQERTTLQNKLLEMNKTVQHMTEAKQEIQRAKDKTSEECARMLLDAQTKVALKDTELKSIKDSSTVQIATLQRKLEEQSEDFKKQLEIERRIIAEKMEADCRESLQNWRVLYEDLYNKVKPFQQQLDAYEAEKNAILNEHGAAQEELNKLSDAYAKLLGHQNLKQKIKHVVKLKEENAQLKQEVSKLRTQLAKEKTVQGELQEQINKIQGVKRFDPSKAFQHSSKENIDPKTPFKESNRNKNQGAIC